MHRSVLVLALLALLAATSACSKKRKEAPPPPQVDAAVESRVDAAVESLASATPGLADRAPKPGSMKLVSSKKREINGVILIAGQGSESALWALNSAIGADGGLPSPPIKAGEGVLYLPLKLGELRGWTAHFHLYRITSDLRAESLKPYAEHAHGVIIVEEDVGKSDWVPLKLGPLLKPLNPKPSVALLGMPALEQAWTAESGVAPIYVSSHSENVLVPALKAVAKGILNRAHDGGDAGPPTTP